MPIYFLHLLLFRYRACLILMRLSLSVVHVQRAFHDQEGEVYAMLGRKMKKFARVCTKLFWRAIYCANLRPEHDFQSGYLSCRVLGRQDPRIIWECNLAITILIQPLTQSCKCGIGSSIFLPRVDSHMRVRLGTPFQACHQHIEQTEKIISVTRRNAYCVYPSFISPANPGTLPLDPFCMSYSLGSTV